MKKILFLFLCLNLINPLFAQDTEMSTDLPEETESNEPNRVISSETDSDNEKNENDEIERKIDQGNYEPENISEEDENL
jgi:hypothetical protein